MTRILRLPDYGAPVGIPAPASWDPASQAAYDRGFADGRASGHESGRLDAEPVTRAITHAITTCAAEVTRAKNEIDTHILQIAEMYVTTVLRHVPDARTNGLLIRIAEAIDAVDTGPIVVSVRSDMVERISAMIGSATGQTNVVVAADDSLSFGEFRLRTEWAEAEGTWDRYLDAARTAIEMYIAEQQP